MLGIPRKSVPDANLAVSDLSLLSEVAPKGLWEPDTLTINRLGAKDLTNVPGQVRLTIAH
jgi:hypothetical protein